MPSPYLTHRIWGPVFLVMGWQLPWILGCATSEPEQNKGAWLSLKVGLVQDLCTSPAAVLLEEASAIILPNPCPPPTASWGVSVPHLKVRWLPSPEAANSGYLKPFPVAGTGCRAVGVAAHGAANLLQEAGITAWRSSRTQQRGGGECSCSPHGLTIPPPGWYACYSLVQPVRLLLSFIQKLKVFSGELGKHPLAKDPRASSSLSFTASH